MSIILRLFVFVFCIASCRTDLDWSRNTKSTRFQSTETRRNNSTRTRTPTTATTTATAATTTTSLPFLVQEASLERLSLIDEAVNTVTELRLVNQKLSNLTLDIRQISSVANQTLQLEASSTEAQDQVNAINAVTSAVDRFNADVKEEAQNAVAQLSSVLLSIRTDIVQAVAQQAALITEQISKIQCGCSSNNNNNNNNNNHYNKPHSDYNNNHNYNSYPPKPSGTSMYVY